ncbi:hypothetical protein GGR92_000004 [Spirosoma lacussanchae]|uniref:hypothetical protein n=1 Tax=Spirosoma lacussanchae TaxID=1884249 RepID=UPI001109D6A2|nr:hypothetical protein [Spirosoma lacussanchae]
MKSIIQSIIKFLKEAYVRINAGTPKFMRKLQWLSGVTAAISAVLIQQNIAVPDWLDWLTSSSTVAFLIGGVIFPQFAGTSSSADIAARVNQP